MKKLLGCLLCVMLLVFGASVSAVAIQTNPGDYTFVGSGGDNDDFANVHAAVAAFTPPPTLPSIDSEFLELAFNPASDHGTWDAPYGVWQYVSIKAGNGNANGGGGWALYFIGDGGASSGYYSTGFNALDGTTLWSDWHDLGSHNVSHVRLWNNVPEPATMLLLGSGLIGLVGFRRKKLLKK